MGKNPQVHTASTHTAGGHDAIQRGYFRLVYNNMRARSKLIGAAVEKPKKTRARINGASTTTVSTQPHKPATMAWLEAAGLVAVVELPMLRPQVLSSPRSALNAPETGAPAFGLPGDRPAPPPPQGLLAARCCGRFGSKIRSARGGHTPRPFRAASASASRRNSTRRASRPGASARPCIRPSAGGGHKEREAHFFVFGCQLGQP